MRTYEVIFIVRPELPEAEVDTLVEQMQQGVAAAGGQVTKVDKWGKRPLAYSVSGQREGRYLRICVANPVAAGEARGRSGNKMALANIRQRFELAYGNRASVDAEEKDRVYNVKLQFPCDESAP